MQDLIKQKIKEMPLWETLRASALSHFEQLGIPTIKNEEWKYSNLALPLKNTFEFVENTNFNTEDLKTISLSKLEGNVLYFINGVYHAELSNIVSDSTEVEILTFKQAAQQNHKVVDQFLGKMAEDNSEAMIAMNTGLFADGSVLIIKKNKVVEQPIILRYITDSRQVSPMVNPRNLIVFEENAQAKIAESHRSIGQNASFTNVVNEIFVSENAYGEFYLVENISDNATLINHTQVVQKDKSHFYAATMTLNGGFVRNNLHLALDGQHIESHMYGLYLPNNKQHIDNHTVVNHMQPNSESNELYKGVLQDQATGVFNGKIFVQQDAQKTNAYQNCRNVITSDAAVMNTKPQLEIWADDVKCSHGTTTGQLNDEAVFYMQSRGIPKPEARNLLMLAFAQDVVNNIKIESIRTYVEECIIEKLSQ